MSSSITLNKGVLVYINVMIGIAVTGARISNVKFMVISSSLHKFQEMAACSVSDRSYRLKPEYSSANEFL
jgi:hypothetical protein